MSELIAEARVLVTPDTAAFRQLLVSQLATATAGVTVPVNVVPAAGAQAAAATTEAVRRQTAAQLSDEARLAAARNKFLADRTTAETVASGKRIAAAEAEVARLLAIETAAAKKSAQLRGAEATAQAAAETKRLAAEQRAAAASAAAYQRSLRGVSSGAASAGLSLVGLRGATLAANAPFLAGAGAAISFGKAMQIATSFNSEIAVLGATTGATGEQLARASEAAREFGRDITLPGVTAGDAAQTITEFAKAGLDLNDAIAATRGGLQLAQAAQLSYADAVTLSANALNAFGLSGNQAVRVADTLANAANLAQGGIEDTALALRQAAGAAAVVGVNFQDTTALLTLLARNGLTGSDAGTALRTAFLRLVNPSKEANKILEDLNVQLRDVNGNVRPEVFADFAAAQRDLTQAQQQANAAIVFGQDAFRAFGFLGREGRTGLDEVTAGLNQTGTAARIAAARMTGLRGAQENLSNQLNDLGLTVGQLADGPLTVLVGLLGDYVGVVNNAARGTLDFASALNELGPGPSTTDILGGVDFTKGLESLAGSINPALGELVRFRSLFGDGADETAEEIKNGGVELRSAIEDSGREAARGAVTFGQQITGAVAQAFGTVRDAIQQGVREARAATIQGIGRAGGQQAGLEEAFNQIVGSGGNTQQQIANLKRQADIQARIIRDAGPNAAGVLLEARREAQAKLASINQQRTALEAQIAADADAARRERERIQKEEIAKADSAVLSSQEAARQAQQNRITQAEDTPALQDDIQRTQSLRALLQRQIAQVRTRISDEQARQQAIEALRQQVFVTTQAIKSLKAAEEQQRQENREAIFERTAENAALRTQIAEARDADENVIVRFIDAEIAIARAAVRRAKQANKGILAAQLELENLRKKKRDLLKEAEADADEDAVGGTSLVDLFNRAEEIARGAGNVGGQNAFNVRAQPRIQAEVQQRLDIVQSRQPMDTFRGAADRLVSAIEELTSTIQQGGNSSTVGPRGGMNGRGLQWEALTKEQRFFYEKQAKSMIDHGLTGRSGI